MSKRHVEDILYDECIKNKKCDKINIKLGIDQKHVLTKNTCLYFISMISRIIICLASLEK